MELLFIYLIMINIFAFIQMGIDKNKAIKGKWRIRESQLILTSFIGGSIGSIIGMKLFRHKTKHKYIVFSFIVSLLIHMLLLVMFIFK